MISNRKAIYNNFGKVALLLIPLLFLAMSFIFSPKASAERWPAETWNAEPSVGQQQMMITLSQNSSHSSPKGTSVKFRLYTNTNVSSNLTETITINGYRDGNPFCGEQGSADVAALSGPSRAIFKPGDCGSKTLNVYKSGSVERADWKDSSKKVLYYYYDIQAEIKGAKPEHSQDNDVRFAFTVEHPSGIFGYISAGGNNMQSLPISSNRGDVYLPDLKIPTGVCGSVKPFEYKLYDSDNAEEYWAQTNYGSGRDFRFVKYGLKRKGEPYKNPIFTDMEHNWESTDSQNFWYPNDNQYVNPDGSVRQSGTAKIWWASAKLENENDRAFLYIRDLGGNNYTVIGMPTDEFDSKVGCPPKRDVKLCPGFLYVYPPFCPRGEYNWAIKATTERSAASVLVGEEAHFTHTLGRATGDDGWISDATSTMGVDVDIYQGSTNVDATSLDVQAYGPIELEKTIEIDTSAPRRVCQKIYFPRGELGTRKDVNYGGKGYTFRWVFLPGWAAADNYSVNAGGYDAWRLASTEREDKDWSKARDNYWWGFHLYGWHDSTVGTTHGNEELHTTDAGLTYYQWHAKNGASSLWEYFGYDSNHPYTANEECIDIVQPKVDQIGDEEYEKGTGDRTIKHVISIDGYPNCPTISVPFIYYGKEGNGTDYYTSDTANFGGATCSKSINKVINGSWLNTQTPGTTVDYGTSYSRGSETGRITVVEVPFARFYGNDIYATGSDTDPAKGTIKFNSHPSWFSSGLTNDQLNGGAGSVAQYAAIAKGIIKNAASAASGFPTASSRLPSYDANNKGTTPTEGLKSASSDLSKARKSPYTEIQNNLPPCGTALSGNNIPANPGCYKGTNAIIGPSLSSYDSKVTINADNVTITGDIKNTSYDVNPSSTGATVYKHIIYNQSPWNTPDAYATNLTPRSYTSADLVSRGIILSDISSVHLTPGYKITLYDGVNLTGNSISFTADDPDLRNHAHPAGNWNDKTNSIKVEKIMPPDINSIGVLVIAAKNIYIDPSVTRIDAILVAENKIYTCAAGTNPKANNKLDDDCRRRLVINGSLAAKDIDFQRVGGSRYLSAGEGVNGVTNMSDGGDLPLNSGQAAEVVNFPAYLYWARPYLLNQSTSGGTVDSIYIVPPRK